MWTFMQVSDAGEGSREAWWSLQTGFYTRRLRAERKLNSGFSHFGSTTPGLAGESKIVDPKSVPAFRMRLWNLLLTVVMVAACSGCGSLGIDSPGSKLVPFGQLLADFANNQVPNYSFIAPNTQDDAHDCPGGASTCSDSQKLSAADQWLQTNIGKVLQSSAFQTDGLLIIVFDESDISDMNHGGGHVAIVLLSPKAKAGFQSTTFYQHQSTVRATLEALGIASLPGASAGATDMGEFLK